VRAGGADLLETDGFCAGSIPFRWSTVFPTHPELWLAPGPVSMLLGHDQFDRLTGGCWKLFGSGLIVTRSVKLSIDSTGVRPDEASGVLRTQSQRKQGGFLGAFSPQAARAR